MTIFMKRNDETAIEDILDHWESRERGVARHQCRESGLRPALLKK